jgi:hypothetical protein
MKSQNPVSVKGKSTINDQIAINYKQKSSNNRDSVKKANNKGTHSKNTSTINHNFCEVVEWGYLCK